MKLAGWRSADPFIQALKKEKTELNPNEFSRTLGLEIADAVPPLQGRRALSLEPGDGRGAVWRELLMGNEIFCLGMEAEEVTHRKGVWGAGWGNAQNSFSSFLPLISCWPLPSG